MSVSAARQKRSFFRCVRTPDVLAILQYSLIRVFQIVLFIGRTL